jgi:hypothetical protein
MFGRKSFIIDKKQKGGEIKKEKCGCWIKEQIEFGQNIVSNRKEGNKKLRRIFQPHLFDFFFNLCVFLFYFHLFVNSKI